jgi:hypothetical protein
MKENYEHALDFDFRLSHLQFGLSGSCMSHHCQSFHRTFSENCTKLDDVLCRIHPESRNRIKSDTWLKIMGYKK